MGDIRFNEQTEPATPSAGKATLYVDSVDGEVAVKKDTGAVQKFLASVDSIFGRTGAVVAVLNDYAASLVNNDSTVTGATVKDALETLQASSLISKEVIPDQLITTSGSITVSHSLGAGAIAILQLVCDTAEASYAAGEIASAVRFGDRVQVEVDATDVNIDYSNKVFVFKTLDRNINDAVDLTNGNWRLRVTLFK